ncbi:hypothetical protein ARMGADRAFT_1008892 [Armillaria gallica]|uniref:Uncharacterized protein n=1 Tax=Armillaria gallica TaxID=47427 RepID=A0A2H3E438_ARMGA|nr:hypothetical protein ARMGADRAFT_1008892 [Armillaria gallica]
MAYLPEGPYGVDHWFSVAHEEVIAMNNSHLIYRGSNRSGYVGVFQRWSRARSFLRCSNTFGPLDPGFERMLLEPEYKTFLGSGATPDSIASERKR